MLQSFGCILAASLMHYSSGVAGEIDAEGLLGYRSLSHTNKMIRGKRSPTILPLPYKMLNSHPSA